MRTLFILLLCVVANTAGAQNFDEYFEDKTLRIDYIFSGNKASQEISLDCLNLSSRWYGKRKRLSEVPVEGNGTITVKDRATSKVIYKNSFSTLFQEWLTTEEAGVTTKAFENVFLVPMPKQPVDVTVELRNNRRETIAKMTHAVDPTDILIRDIGEHKTKYETMLKAADPENCINIAFVAEGYTEAEMPIFLEDVNKSLGALFAHEPFKSRKASFNIIAVEAASEDSGTSVPRDGIWKRTALGSHFDTFYSSRYLTTLHLKKLHDVLAGLPYEHIIILVNTEVYGGGGILNSYNLSAAHNPKTLPVVVHEFGHSFAGLGDEYAYENEAIPMYPTDVEPWEPNLTTMVDFKSKWASLIDKNTPVPTPANEKYADKVGVFEGAGYSLKGVYRPMQDCRMRTNENPDFCPVCRQAIDRLISFYVE
ncbi:MAG: M64 family metallopeptidase [Prevotella sp.]|uniref:M64 family metallopeptidase n=1 Tax=Prevotella sp. TaxID=59823 RepID=UPI002A307448|nr:M64 family metallopeptidase [Prevotella sp.]MDD7319200.1 M64 family metallopeptidase [Prevotellaceae bacterium]MDY4020068.1 M64 family metallopeptidase [Prevotella sp.]